MKPVRMIAVLVVSVVIWATPGVAETLPPGDAKGWFKTGTGALTRGQLTSYYDAVIQRKKRNCIAKLAYGDSKFTTLNDIAVRSAIKAKFLDANHQKLRAEMLDADLGRNPARLEHFLNQRFQEHLDVLSTYYLAFIEKDISNCKAKVGLGQSKMDSMRRKAVLSALKVQFLEANREELASAMIESDVGTCTAKLDHFINLRFNNFIHPRLMTYLTSP